MRWQIRSAVIELVQGDITLQEVDCIVNAANQSLMGGGGVDGAIHRRGGPAIMQDTRQRYPDGCPTGSAVISGAGLLKAEYVVHAVGPVWSGGGRGEADLLASAFARSLKLAAQHDCQSIALPALSTGAYGYPLADAAEIALKTAASFLAANQQPALVRFVLFDRPALDVFVRVLEQVRSEF
jgi:O-acetyl-ADP-ribose deacetylase (regulator of RNase III)